MNYMNNFIKNSDSKFKITYTLYNSNNIVVEFHSKVILQIKILMYI